MNQFAESKSLGRLGVRLVIDRIDGVDCDTEVEIEAGTLCWVSGEKRNEFLGKLNQIIAEYQI